MCPIHHFRISETDEYENEEPTAVRLSTCVEQIHSSRTNPFSVIQSQLLTNSRYIREDILRDIVQISKMFFGITSV